LVQGLHEAVKEVNLLEELGEEASQKIIELEALYKKLREDTQKMREGKTKLEGMVESHDELIMEFTDKYGYNRSDEDANNEDEDEDDGGDIVAPPPTVPPPVHAPPATVTPEEIIVEEDPVKMVP
jgi:Fic family protein